MTVTYEDVEGIAVADGDIDLGPVELLRTPAEFDAALELGGEDDVQYAFTPVPLWGDPWPSGTVYFVRPTFSYTTNKSIRDAMVAMGSVEGWPSFGWPPKTGPTPATATGLKFVAISPLMSLFKDHVYFTGSLTVPPGNGRSSVGRKGGRQFVSFSMLDIFNDVALPQGLVHHELGHTVGLNHEHQRSDRDDFVTVWWFCMSPNSWGNFEKRPGFPLGPYDPSSLMHYTKNTFSTLGCPTLTSKSGSPLGGNSLSASDIAGLNWLAGWN